MHAQISRDVLIGVLNNIMLIMVLSRRGVVALNNVRRIKCSNAAAALQVLAMVSTSSEPRCVEVQFLSSPSPSDHFQLSQIVRCLHVTGPEQQSGGRPRPELQVLPLARNIHPLV